MVPLSRKRIRGSGLSKEGGQTIVEFALVLPVFLLLMLGLLDIGRAYFTDQIILNAAREAARTGVLPETTVANARTTAINVLNSGNLNCPGVAGLGCETINITNAGTGVTPGSVTTVTVTFPFETLTGNLIPGWTGIVNISQTISMRHE